MRIVFAGTPEFAVPCLRAAARHQEVVAVYTQPDRPAGRGRGLMASPVKLEAIERGIPVFQPETLKDSAAQEQLLAQGRPVFVDYTAAWCVTCQYNKRTTLSDAKVLADFAAHGVALLRADWTRREPTITAALAALGRNGVPVYVLLAPGKAPIVMTELLTRQEVHDALATL